MCTEYLHSKLYIILFVRLHLTTIDYLTCDDTSILNMYPAQYIFVVLSTVTKVFGHLIRECDKGCVFYVEIRF